MTNDPRIENNADMLSKRYNWFDVAREAFTAGFYMSDEMRNGEYIKNADSFDINKMFASWLKEPRDD